MPRNSKRLTSVTAAWTRLRRLLRFGASDDAAIVNSLPEGVIDKSQALPPTSTDPPDTDIKP